MNELRKASFIHTERGTDLILSFALAGEPDPVHMESLTLIRTPRFESLVSPDERGVSVSLECDDQNDILEHFEFRSADQQVLIRSRQRRFTVDVSGVPKSEISEMAKLIRVMCFDDSFTLGGIDQVE